jgi:hypothetical protein
MFAIMTGALARHLSPQAASFGNLVFSMHDVDELSELLRSAGFSRIGPQAVGSGASADRFGTHIAG